MSRVAVACARPFAFSIDYLELCAQYLVSGVPIAMDAGGAPGVKYIKEKAALVCFCVTSARHHISTVYPVPETKHMQLST